MRLFAAGFSCMLLALAASAQDDLRARQQAGTVSTEPISEAPSPNPRALQPRPDSATPPPPDLPAMLTRMAKSEDPELRRRSVEGISTLAPAVAGVHLLLMCGDANPDVRAAALGKIKERDPDALREQLLDLLSRPEGAALVEADGSLQALGPALADGMLKLLQDGDAPMERRTLAAYCLGQMRHAEAFDTLRDLMWIAPTELGYACVDALFALDDARLEEDWLKLAQVPDPWLQSYAVSALSREPTQAGLDALYNVAAGLIPSSMAVQEEALRGIIVWPAPLSVPYLIAILRFNPRLQLATMDALRQASGVDVGRYPGSWFEWYRLEMEGAPVAGEEAPPPLEPGNSGNNLLQTVDFVPPPLKAN